MAESVRCAPGLTSDEVIALPDSELVHLAYTFIDRINYEGGTDPAVSDTLYLLFDELTERYCPDARWASYADIVMSG
jgi:hypothetical protein